MAGTSKFLKYWCGRVWQTIVNLSNIGVAAAIPATLVPPALTFLEKIQKVGKTVDIHFFENVAFGKNLTLQQLSIIADTKISSKATAIRCNNYN